MKPSTIALACVTPLALALTLAGCGGSTEPTPDPSGTYALVSLDGHPLPAPATARNTDVTALERATLTLAGTPGDLMFWVTANDRSVMHHVDIGWDGNADGTVAVNLLPTGGGVSEHTATLRSDTLTVTFPLLIVDLPGGTYAFVKQ